MTTYTSNQGDCYIVRVAGSYFKNGLNAATRGKTCAQESAATCESPSQLTHMSMLGQADEYSWLLRCHLLHPISCGLGQDGEMSLSMAWRGMAEAGPGGIYGREDNFWAIGIHIIRMQECLSRPYPSDRLSST